MRRVSIRRVGRTLLPHFDLGQKPSCRDSLSIATHPFFARYRSSSKHRKITPRTSISDYLEWAKRDSTSLSTKAGRTDDSIPENGDISPTSLTSRFWQRLPCVWACPEFWEALLVGKLAELLVRIPGLKARHPCDIPHGAARRVKEKNEAQEEERSVRFDIQWRVVIGATAKDAGVIPATIPTPPRPEAAH